MDNIDVKGRILLAARDLFIKRGYDAASVRDIAAASGTNVAMVNYYFGSKYHLFEIIFEEALSLLFQRIFTVVQSDLSFEDLLELWIKSYYDILMENPEIPIFILKEVNQNPSGLTARILRLEPYNLYVKISARVEEEVKKGTIRETPTLDFLLNVLSLCVFPFMFGTIGTRVAEKTFEEYNEVLKGHREYVVEFVKNALRP